MNPPARPAFAHLLRWFMPAFTVGVECSRPDRGGLAQSAVSGMNHEPAFLQAMVNDPSAAALFADWLEERGDPRGELLRLLHLLTQSIDHPTRPVLEERLRALVAA